MTAVAPCLDRRQPGLRHRLGNGDDPRSVFDEAAMCARADADIFAVAPIGEIMAAFRARLRVVGDLVGRQTMAGGDILREAVEIGGLVVVRHDELAGGLQRVERRCLPRSSAGKATDGRRRGRSPLPARAPRRPASGRGAHRSGRRTDAGRCRAPGRSRRSASSTLCSRPRDLQVAVVQRLHAERDAVDAGGAVAAEALGLDRRRVGFQRDLDRRPARPVRRDGVEHGADRLRLHQRRRAAAEEDAGDLRGPVRARMVASSRAKAPRRSAAGRPAGGGHAELKSQ